MAAIKVIRDGAEKESEKVQGRHATLWNEEKPTTTQRAADQPLLLVVVVFEEKYAVHRVLQSRREGQAREALR